MKRYSVIFIIVLLISMFFPVSVFAKPGKGNVKGDVVDIDPGSGILTIVTKKGETLLVIAPVGFDFQGIEVGDSVMVKGETQEDGSILADSIKEVGKGSDDDNDEVENETEGSKDNSAYCADEKQEDSHPLANKIAERFGVAEEWVMSYLCDGYSIGAIMLALKTSEINGVDPVTLLAGRSQGQGWGQIWKELGLIGGEREGHSPPGQLKKPDHTDP